MDLLGNSYWNSYILHPCTWSWPCTSSTSLTQCSSFFSSLQWLTSPQRPSLSFIKYMFIIMAITNVFYYVFLLLFFFIMTTTFILNHIVRCALCVCVAMWELVSVRFTWMILCASQTCSLKYKYLLGYAVCPLNKVEETKLALLHVIKVSGTPPHLRVMWRDVDDSTWLNVGDKGLD